MSLTPHHVTKDLFAMNSHISTTFFGDDGALQFSHTGTSSSGLDWVYIQATDRIYTRGVYIGGTSAFDGTYLVAFDPLLEDLSQTSVKKLPNVDPPLGFWPGQYNTVTGEQRLFGYRGLTDQSLLEYSAISLELITTNAFDKPGGPFITFMRNGPNNPEVGPRSWGQDSIGPGEAQHRWQMFEGLTDGVPGETILQGSNVYEGLALAVNTHRGSANGSSGEFNAACVWVDLNGGECVGALLGEDGNPLPGESTYLDAPGGEPRHYAATVNWSKVQFVPDADSRIFSRPKGQLVFTSEHNADNETAGTGDLYVRFVDFNPFDLAPATGFPARVHGRVTLITRGQFDYDMGAVTLTSSQCQRQAFFVPNDELVVTYHGLGDVTEPVVGRYALNSWRNDVEVVHVMPPSPGSSVQEADVITFSIFVTGDMGEPVAGADVAWLLQGLVSRNENVDWEANPVQNLVNVPIDRPATFKTQVAFENGAELVLTVDWDINNRTTGEVELLKAVVPSAVYQVDYQHMRVPASPAIGTIAESDDKTDAAGIATCKVFYNNTLDLGEGAFDQLTATVTNRFDDAG